MAVGSWAKVNLRPTAASFDTRRPTVYDARMASPRTYYYLLDGLTPDKGQRIKRALEQVPDIKSIIVGLSHGVVEIRATRDPEVQIKMACSIAGVTFRLRVSRKNL